MTAIKPLYLFEKEEIRTLTLTNRRRYCGFTFEQIGYIKRCKRIVNLQGRIRNGFKKRLRIIGTG